MTLYLEKEVIVTLDKLASIGRTSRSRIVEGLVRAELEKQGHRLSASDRRQIAAAQISSGPLSDARALAAKAEEKSDREHRKSK